MSKTPSELRALLEKPLPLQTRRDLQEELEGLVCGYCEKEVGDDFNPRCGCLDYLEDLPEVAGEWA